MANEEIPTASTSILRDLSLDDSTALTMRTRRKNIPTWDSVNYINFIVALELKVDMKFKVADVQSFPNGCGIVTETARMLAQGSGCCPKNHRKDAHECYSIQVNFFSPFYR
jgi:hypothetical protein